MTEPLRLGTRGSALARSQSSLVADALRECGEEVVLVPVVTEGDLRPPGTTWGEGAFVGALEAALRDGTVDLAVHSAKDVPVQPETDLLVAAYPERADPRDCVVSRSGRPLAGLPAGAVVGTDSPRRAGFVRAARPDLRVVPLHGNVDTRLRSLDRGDVDALVLAVAGLVRLGREDRITGVLDPSVLPPAPGQGALAIQVRSADDDLRRRVARVDHGPTRRAVTAERTVLRVSGGGCRAPLGALATVSGPDFRLLAGAVHPSGSRLLVESRSGGVDEAQEFAEALGRLLADRVRASIPGGETAGVGNGVTP